MSTLELRQVTKAFGPTKVIHGIDLAIAHGEFIVFVGPSGCGKSTLLRMIAGLEPVFIRRGISDRRLQVVNDIAGRRARPRHGVPELCALIRT